MERRDRSRRFTDGPDPEASVGPLPAPGSLVLLLSFGDVWEDTGSCFWPGKHRKYC